MHHVTQAVEASSSTPAGYAAHSQGFRRATFVDHPTGSVHMGVGLCTLEPNGWIQPHLHSFEESFIVLEGSLLAQLGEAAIALSTGDYGDRVPGLRCPEVPLQAAGDLDPPTIQRRLTVDSAGPHSSYE